MHVEASMLKDGMLKDGMLKDGMLKDGMLKDGMLKDGMLKDGMLKDVTYAGNTKSECNKISLAPSSQQGSLLLFLIHILPRLKSHQYMTILADMQSVGALLTATGPCLLQMHLNRNQKISTGL